MWFGLSTLAAPFPLPAEHPWAGSGAELLSGAPLVLRIPDFLTAEECVALREAAQLYEQSAASHEPQSCRDWARMGECTSNAAYMLENCAASCADGVSLAARPANSHRAPGRTEIGTWWLDAKQDALVRRIEARIGNLTGLERHGGEVDMKLTAHASQPRRSTRAYSLHHEKIAKPRRVLTVLVYLTSSAADADGGHTVFPATSSPAAARAFRAITPPLGQYYRVDDNPNTAHRSMSDTVGLLSPEARADAHVRQAQQSADEACDAAAAGDAASARELSDDAATPSVMSSALDAIRRLAGGSHAALATRPVAGTAVIWYHEQLSAVAPSERRRGREERVGGAASAATQMADLGEAINGAPSVAGPRLMVDPLAWHAGCVIRGGVSVGSERERWAIQIFKEHHEAPSEDEQTTSVAGAPPPPPPPSPPPPEAFFEVLKAHQTAATAARQRDERAAYVALAAAALFAALLVVAAAACVWRAARSFRAGRLGGGKVRRPPVPKGASTPPQGSSSGKSKMKRR